MAPKSALEMYCTVAVMISYSHDCNRRDLCHVTQPRARINVSCSRAGQKRGAGVRETAIGPRQRRAKDSKGWVPDQRRDRAGQGGTKTA
jgi:hypothetical protein